MMHFRSLRCSINHKSLALLILFTWKILLLRMSQICLDFDHLSIVDPMARTLGFE